MHGKRKQGILLFLSEPDIIRKDGKFIVEDAKGYRTEAYKLKKKLLLWVFGHHIKEV